MVWRGAFCLPWNISGGVSWRKTCMAVTAGCKGFEDIVDSSSVGSWNCGGNSNEGPWGCAAAGTSKGRGEISSWGSIDRSKHSRRGSLGCGVYCKGSDKASWWCTWLLHGCNSGNGTGSSQRGENDPGGHCSLEGWRFLYKFSLLLHCEVSQV